MEQKTPLNKTLLTTKEAAKYLNISESTLRQSRMNGARDGRFPPPPYIKLGRTVRYKFEDLNTWLENYSEKEEIDLDV